MALPREWLVSSRLQMAGLRAGSDGFAPFKLVWLRTRCGVHGSVTLSRLRGRCREIMRRVYACLQCVHAGYAAVEKMGMLW